MFNKPVNKKSAWAAAIFGGTPARVICLSFIAVILFGTLLLTLPLSSRSGGFTSFSDALFTATSATCVTGLVVQDTYLYWSTFGQAVILSLIQIGGLGLVTLTSFFNVIIGRRLGLRSMELARESANTDSFADVKHMLRAIIVITFLVEIIGAVLLAFTFVPLYGLADGLWTSVFLSISAFCNAGFDLLGREGAYISLTGFVSLPQVYLVVSLLVILGGLGFTVWRELLRYHRDRRLSLHSMLVLIMTGCLLLFGTIAFAALEWRNPQTLGALSFFDKLGASFFQSVTCRTAGFNTIDQAAMGNAGKLVSSLLMFIGASPASTGGGIKVTTIAVIIMTIVSVMRGYGDAVILRRKVESRAVYRAFALFFMALLVVAPSVMLLVLPFDGVPNATTDVIFETVSAFSTAGLSVGVTAQLGTAWRYLLVLLMYLGRVGPLSLIVSLTMHTPARREVLPQGKILIG